MLEGASSAGTIVGAVLETAGYVAQAQILETFGEFWQKFGFLLYLISCAAGLISIVLTGGFRGARYMLIGPTLFYFMVMERAPIPSTVWRFGEREPVAVTEKFAGAMETYRPNGEVLVSRVFGLYTRLSGQFMQELTDFIMDFSDDDSFLFIARNQAAYALMSIGPQKEGTATMLTYTLYDQCPDMLNTLIQLSGKTFSDSHLNLLALQAPKSKASSQTLDATRLAREDLRRRYKEAAENKRMTPDLTMREFMVREISMAQQGAGRNYATEFNLGDPNTFVERGGGEAVLTCGQALQVFEDAAMRDGEWFQKYMQEAQLDKQILASPETRNKLCNAIASKFHSEYVEGANCNLGLTSMIMLLKNRLHGNGIGDFTNRATAKMRLIPSVNEEYCLNKIYGRSPEDMRMKKRVGESTEFRLRQVQEGLQTRQVLEARGDSGREDWCSYFAVEAPGMLETAVDQQHIDARGLLGKIYAFALNLPYYQAVMLFWLAFAYPFMALMLLIPARAPLFVYAPLSWIWLKSWDVGFAVVAVFDKILWNVLPRSEVPYSLQAPNNDILPDLLGAVLRSDPTYDIHAHFNYVALAMLAVPTLTGVMIMKGKTAVFSAFVTAPGQLAQESYNRSRAVASQWVLHGRQFRSQELQGALTQAMTTYGAGYSNSPVLPDAAKFGVMAGMATNLAGLISQRSPLGDAAQPHVRRLMSGVKDGSAAAWSVFETELKSHAEYVRTFDPRFGVNGEITRRYRSNIASLDGTPGWDVEGVRGRGKDVWDADLKALMAKFNLSLDWAGKTLKATAAPLSNVSPTIAGGAGRAVDGLLVGGAMGYSYRDPNNPDKQ